MQSGVYLMPTILKINHVFCVFWVLALHFVLTSKPTQEWWWSLVAGSVHSVWIKDWDHRVWHTKFDRDSPFCLSHKKRMVLFAYTWSVLKKSYVFVCMFFYHYKNITRDKNHQKKKIEDNIAKSKENHRTHDWTGVPSTLPLLHKGPEGLVYRCIWVTTPENWKALIKRSLLRNKEKTQINKVTMGKEDPRTHPQKNKGS